MSFFIYICVKIVYFAYLHLRKDMVEYNHGSGQDEKQAAQW